MIKITSIDEKLQSVVPIDKEKIDQIIERSTAVISNKGKAILSVIILFIVASFKLAYDSLTTNQQTSILFVCFALFFTGLLTLVFSFLYTRGSLNKKDVEMVIANALKDKETLQKTTELIIAVKEIILDDRKEANTQIGKVMDHTVETIKAITTTFNQAIIKFQSGEFEPIEVASPAEIEEISADLAVVIKDSFKPLKTIRILDTTKKTKKLTDSRSIFDKV